MSQGWGSNEVSHAGSSAGISNEGLAGITEIRPANGAAGPSRSVRLRGHIGAAGGDRTHDILSHSQAFCR